MKHRKLPLVAALVLPLFLAACEKAPETQTTSTSPAPATKAAEPKPAEPAAAPSAAPKADVPGRTVAFELTSPAPVGALQIDITYTGEGRFVGDADAVACETKIEGALSSFNHIVAEKKLRAAYVAVKGFGGPVRFCECKFQGEAKPEDFTVAVKDSSSPELTPLDPPPAIKVVLD